MNKLILFGVASAFSQLVLFYGVLGGVVWKFQKSYKLLVVLFQLITIFSAFGFISFSQYYINVVLDIPSHEALATPRFIWLFSYAISVFHWIFIILKVQKKNTQNRGMDNPK